MPTRIRFKSITKELLDTNASNNSLIQGDPYLLYDVPSIAIPLTPYAYGEVFLTTIVEFNYAGYLVCNDPFSKYIERLQFSNDTITIAYVELYDGPVEGGVSSLNAGYFGSSEGKNIRKLSFITETLTSLLLVLSNNRKGICSLENYMFGYFIGGMTNNNCINSIDKLNFNTESFVFSFLFISPIAYAEGTSNNINKGLIIGGNINITDKTNSIISIDFLNDNLIPFSNNIRSSSNTLSCVENDIYSYVTGFGNNDNRIDKIDFNTQVVTTLSVSLENGNIRNCEGVSSNNHGYWCGGYNDISNVSVNSINKFQFSNNTLVSINLTLKQSAKDLTSIQRKGV